MPRPRKSEMTEDGAASDGAVLPDALVNLIDPTLPKAPQVYDVIRRAIIGLLLPPGSAINEKAICEQLSISRTPLREAILRLSAENLVAIVPNSATYVSKIDLQSVFDGQLVRDALEMKVVRLAAVRMSSAFQRDIEVNMYHQERLAAECDYGGFYELDEAFHSTICEIGASARVWKIINGAKAQLDRVRRLAIPSHNHLGIVLKEHALIVDGLRLRDPEAAAAAMKVHLDRVFETIRTLMVERRDYFAAPSLEVLDGYAFETRGGPGPLAAAAMKL